MKPGGKTSMDENRPDAGTCPTRVWAIWPREPCEPGSLHGDSRRVVPVLGVFGPADFDGGDVKDRQFACGLRMADGGGDEVCGLITCEHEDLSDLR